MAGAARWSGLLAQLGERRRRVDVPEDADRVRAVMRPRRPSRSSSSNTPTPEAFTTTSARAASAITAAPPPRSPDRPHLGPVRRVDVAVVLAVESVGLVEGDVVAARGEIAGEAAVIGGRAVPVGGQEARSVEGDLHADISTAGACAMRRFRDGQKLVDAVGAGVTLPDRLEAARGQRGAKRRIVAQGARWRSSRRRCARRDNRRRAGTGLPHRCHGALDERDAAGERLEDADGRDAGQRVDIEAARHVHGREMAGEDLRRRGHSASQPR